MNNSTSTTGSVSASLAPIDKFSTVLTAVGVVAAILVLECVVRKEIKLPWGVRMTMILKCATLFICEFLVGLVYIPLKTRPDLFYFPAWLDRIFAIIRTVRGWTWIPL